MTRLPRRNAPGILDEGVWTAHRSIGRCWLRPSRTFEAIVSILAMQSEWVPPRLNLDEPSEDCLLDHVLGDGRSRSAATVFSNSFAFGGINASLVFRRIGGASASRVEKSEA